MSPNELNHVRKTLGIGRKDFGRRVGLQGRSNNIWIEVKRMETGEREIPASVAAAARRLMDEA